MSIYQTWITYSNYLYSDIEAENESRYLYAWLDKHPDVRTVVTGSPNQIHANLYPFPRI